MKLVVWTNFGRTRVNPYLWQSRNNEPWSSVHRHVWQWVTPLFSFHGCRFSSDDQVHWAEHLWKCLFDEKYKYWRGFRRFYTKFCTLNYFLNRERYNIITYFIIITYVILKLRSLEIREHSSFTREFEFFERIRVLLIIDEIMS